MPRCRKPGECFGRIHIHNDRIVFDRNLDHEVCIFANQVLGTDIAAKRRHVIEEPTVPEYRDYRVFHSRWEHK